MWRKPIWCYNYFINDNFINLPVIKQFGHGQTWSTDYYNSCEIRNDPPHHLFQLTTEGFGCYRDTTGEHKIMPGQGFLCNPLKSGIEYFYPEEATETWRFIFLVIYGGASIFEEIQEKYGTIYDINKNNSIFKRLTPDIKPAINSFVSKDIRADEAVGIAMDFINLLIKSGTKSEVDDSKSQVTRNAMQIIRCNSMKGLNVESLSKSVQVTPEHLSRLFKLETGYGPLHFIIQEKLNLAKHLLIATNLRIKEIAMRSGFDSPRDFNRTFKKVLILTPGEFRKHQKH